MSLLFGIINTTQQPANEHSLSVLYGGIAHFPHERKAFLVKDNVGFGHALTYNTPEAVYEQMPVYAAEQQLLFVAEGRIDNRAELFSALGMRLDATVSDGQLMLKAYLKWGEATPDKLLGDWSFVAFDQRSQELFIARDHHGYTALYYCFANQQFIFGSSIKSLLAFEGVSKKINQEHLIRGLALWHKSTGDNQTSYEGIYTLPPAHTLKLKNGQVELKRYWFPENIEPIYRKNHQDYANELNEILTEAVNARLRSYRPVASMLSGGLDSSTVSFLAAELLAQRGIRLPTLSHVPLYTEELKKLKETNQFFDESPYIEATVQASGNIDALLLNSAHFTPTEGIFKIIGCHNSVIHAACNAYWIVDIMETAQRNDYGTLLSGEHGNASISFTGIDFLLPFSHVGLLRNPKKFIKAKILKPLALTYFPKFVNRRFGGIEDYILTGYLRPEAVKDWGIIDDIRANQSGFHRYYANAKEGMNHILMPGQNPRCLYGANSKHLYGVEKRDPTADKRVLEYCLSVPNEAFFDENGNQKMLLKRMMKNRLPDKVLFEQKKGLQSADIAYRALAEQQTISNLIAQVSKNELFNQIVDTQKLQTDWQSFTGATNQHVLYPQTILKTLMVGCFLNKND
jgi:asparagine synthase (glutamine-hydrolysing)